MTPFRSFIGVANDKGGIGKSLTSALLIEELASDGSPWRLVEIEQRSNFTQQNYEHPSGTDLLTIALLTQNERANQTEPSLAPLDSLWDLIPPDDGEQLDSRILVDFGASAFQSFLLWGLQKRGLQPFRKAGYGFLFFIPVQGGDQECADFFNMNAPLLMKLGKVVLVKNLREGADFSCLDTKLVSQVPAITMLYQGPPLSVELQQSRRRVTFRQMANTSSASRRARIDADICADHFSTQFRDVKGTFGL